METVNETRTGKTYIDEDAVIKVFKVNDKHSL